MTTKDAIIKIEVNDCADEYRNTEPDLSSEDSLVSLFTKPGWTTPKLARAVIGARVLGINPVDYLPANKPLFLTGTGVAIAQVVSKRHIEAQTPSGNTYTVREFVAPVREEGEDDDQLSGDTQESDVTLSPSSEPESYAPVQSEEGKGRAMDYLLKRVPGYIYGRLKIIAVNGGDVKAAAEELKGKIDELVERLG
jgi:hypothetical protein